MEKKLPDKPSELIRLALNDLIQTEQDDRFIINMRELFTPIGDGKCEVCLAGALIAQTLGKKNDIIKRMMFQNFRPDIEQKLEALDSFQMGCITFGLSQMKILINTGLPNFINVPEYKDDREGFFRKMNKMADMLEHAGW